MTGSFPENDADHENRVRTDDRWINLRDATDSQNNANKLKASRNTSGVKGVGRSHGKFRATIRVNGCFKHLGHFLDIDKASAAYSKAAIEHFGAFARIN
jgi:hypothetical protein